MWERGGGVGGGAVLDSRCKIIFFRGITEQCLGPPSLIFDILNGTCGFRVSLDDSMSRGSLFINDIVNYHVTAS
jgi:hypothetical protein